MQVEDLRRSMHIVKELCTYVRTQGGGLVSVVRGALGPLLYKTIKEELNYEHQVLEGKAERKTVHTHLQSSFKLAVCVRTLG